MTSAAQQHLAIEQRIRACLHGGDLAQAATAAIEGYGDEVLGFIAGMVREPNSQREVFSMFCEDLWRGLASFKWRSTLRTWCYAIARNAFLRHHRKLTQARQREQPLRESQMTDWTVRMRESTAPYRRTDVKSRFRLLRERLDSDDQMLLILRVDRDMAWTDIAQVMTGPLTAPQLKTHAAALRKRFQRIKTTLRKLALEAELIPHSN